MTNIRRALQAAAGVDESFDAEDVFSTYLVTGDGSAYTANNGIDLDGKGGLVWLKARSAAGYNHTLYDTARSGTLFSDATNGSGDYASEIASYNSNGFTTVSSGAVYNNVNGVTYVGWSFRKAPGFFDIVEFGGESGGTTISHNLGSVPGLVITKRIDDTGNWYVWRSSDLTAELYLDLGIGEASVTQPAASSTEWTLRSGLSNPSATYVSYLFADLDGISKCGTYSGTGVAQNIECGFETTARFLIIKRVDNAGSWNMVDSTRGYGAGNDPVLWADGTGAESTGIDFVTTYSGGFAVTTSGQVNTDTATYIYLAIA